MHFYMFMIYDIHPNKLWECLIILVIRAQKHSFSPCQRPLTKKKINFLSIALTYFSTDNIRKVRWNTFVIWKSINRNMENIASCKCCHFNYPSQITWWLYKCPSSSISFYHAKSVKAAKAKSKSMRFFKYCIETEIEKIICPSYFRVLIENPHIETEIKNSYSFIGLMTWLRMRFSDTGHY